VVWGEDGALFLHDLAGRGFLPTLFEPYTGYLQFWPRVLTKLAITVARPEQYGSVITIVSCACVGIIAAAVYVWSSAATSSPWFRAMLALLVVTVPLAPVEVLGNVANLHSYLLWATAWLLLWTPRSWAGAVALALLAASFALTEIQVVFVLPIVLVNLRSARAWLVRGGLVIGLGAQLLASLGHPRLTQPDHLNTESTVAGWLVNGGLGAVVGDERVAGNHLADWGLQLAVVVWLVFVACFVYVLVRGDRRERVLACAFLTASAVVWFAAMWANANVFLTPMFDYAHYDANSFRASMHYYRYGVPSSLFLAGLLVLAAATRHRRVRDAGPTGRRPARGRIALVAAGALPVVLLAVQLLSFSTTHSYRVGVSPWADGFRVAAETCRQDASATVQVAQAPGGWAAELPCGFVR
jgi:hypothetical protein